MRQRLIALPGGSAQSSAQFTAPDDLPASPAPVPLHIVRTWDTDAREAAWQEAQRAGEHDPDAAAYLLACLHADEADEAEETDDAGEASAHAMPARAPAPPPAGKPFDPMRLLARAVKFYHWSHADTLHMPWRTFLGYVREADIMNQEEQEAYDRAMAQGRGQSRGRATDASGTVAGAGAIVREATWR